MHLTHDKKQDRENVAQQKLENSDQGTLTRTRNVITVAGRDGTFITNARWCQNHSAEDSAAQRQRKRWCSCAVVSKLRRTQSLRPVTKGTSAWESKEEYHDDITGHRLDAREVRRARQKEVECCRPMQVNEKVPLAEGRLGACKGGIVLPHRPGYVMPGNAMRLGSRGRPPCHSKISPSLTVDGL